MRNLIPLFAVLLISTTATAATFAEDLSILFPQAQSVAEASLLISPSTPTAHGVVLPKTLFDQLPRLTFNIPEDRIYGVLRVVGARLDPCFPGVDAPATPTTDCHPQLRLVVQPLDLIQSPSIPYPPSGHAEEDTAMHLFYDLSASQLKSLINALQALRVRYGLVDGNDPWALGVHQGLAKQGLASPYARELIALLLGAMDDRNLSRVTFFLLRGRHSWMFGGFLTTTPLTPLPIGTIQNAPADPNEKNAVVQTVSRFQGLNTNVTPLPAAGDSLQFFTKEPQVGQEAEVRNQLTVVNRVENPWFHSPATMDCFSCHAAESARKYSIQKLGPGVAQTASAYVARVHLALDPQPGPVETAQFRAFGYRDGVPAIMQRVINETDSIINSLARQ